MGMAASQARHLALVARKSNCEYEGQQINQARTALANQSANLFNQMLGLSVPVPPSTQDFTKTQYSYTDGLNASTIDSWQQLATPEEEYNYVVTSHYYTDVYTGSQKKMSDPQVQYSTTGMIGSYDEINTALRELTTARAEYDKISDDYNKILSNYESAVAAKGTAETAAQIAINTKNAAQTAFDNASAEYTTAQNNVNNYYTETYEPAETTLEEAEAAYTNAQNNIKNIDSYKSDDKTYTADDTRQAPSGTNTKYEIGSDIYTPFDELDETIKNNILDSLTTLSNNGAIIRDNYPNDELYYDTTNNVLAFKSDLNNLISGSDSIPVYNVGDATTSNSIRNISDSLKTTLSNTKTSYENALSNFNIISPRYEELLNIQETKRIAYESASSVLAEANKQVTAAEADYLVANTNFQNAETELNEANEEYGPTINAYEAALETFKSYQTPSYLGNCELKLLENLDENQLAELKQVVADMKNNEINTAINKCFDDDGNYLGGVYKFKLNGVTYYTCFEDLSNSYNSGTGINHIDGQTKLSYYNASYVSTKIEKTDKALLETDGNGRFVSVRFSDDSVTYTLSMETITDSAAYEDAMNQYIYENAKYDKMIQDINAKTSIIQQQDQQLELRLKQLDTEHNALSNEIEAVSKVVKDNIEKSFKTFSD